MSAGELLNSAVALMRPRAEAKGLDFSMVIEGQLPGTIETDGVKFTQILVNLLSNAIKYTQQGGVVLRVRCRVLAATGALELVIRVEDTGMGISAEDLPGLFEPFSRVLDKRLDREIEGSGLGLAIAAGYAGLLEASIGVESRPEHGSTFTFALHAGSVDTAAMLDAKALLAQERSEPGETTAVASLSGLHILLCEDSSAIATLMTFLLEGAGALVVHCANGRLGVEHVLSSQRRGEEPALVLMDMQMPLMDGYEAARTLRDHGYARPIAALTAFAMAGDETKCLEAGCDFYLRKPISPATFIAEIAGFLEGTQDSAMN